MLVLSIGVNTWALFKPMIDLWSSMVVSLLSRTQQCQEHPKDSTLPKSWTVLQSIVCGVQTFCASHCFAISPTTFNLILSVSMNAHCLSIGYHAETLTLINPITSLKSHFGDASARLWYIKHECNRYTSIKFPPRSLLSSNIVWP
jgi:hypothetical protein